MAWRLGNWISSGLLALVSTCALAQTTPAPQALQPLSPETISAALARPIGQTVRAPRTSGSVDLKGKRFYIAEYLLLFDLSGEVPVQPLAGSVLGTPVGDKPALLAYRSALDITALQQLTDRAWADLQQRLAQAEITLADAGDTVRQHGAVYAATEPASTPAAPVVLESKTGDSSRRYLALAPTGMRLVPRTVAGIGLGNIAARVSYPAQGVEGLSLAMAVHFSALDAPGARASHFAPAAGAAAGVAAGVAADTPALSPLLELAPAPAAALVHGHAQLALVNLDEALVLAGEFARLRATPAAEPAPRDGLAPLLLLGRRLLGGAGAVTVPALLELDGPSTARGVLYLLGAANQAIADALKAARQP